MNTLQINNNALYIDQNQTDPIIIIKNEEHLHIHIKNNIKVSIIELFINQSPHDCTRDFQIERNAQLEYLKIQDLTQDINIKTQINLEQNAKLNMTHFELGNNINTNTYNCNLDKNDAHLNINALVKLFNNNQSTSSFLTTHNAKNCLSSVNYLHSLDEQSKATFQAKTIVNKSALYSKAYQNSNTILLHDEATIFAQPHLEILIDELEASHGATVGSINQEELLYLQSRGISKQKAHEMLLKAFENKIYDNIQELKLIEFVKNYKRSDYV